MSKTMAVHVHYKSLYISLPSSAKQERDMTKFCVVWGTRTTTANFPYIHLELNAVISYLSWARFNLYFINESRDTLKSLSLFPLVKTISNLNMEHSIKFEMSLLLKNYPSWFTYSTQRRVWSFHVVVLQRTTKKCTKNYNARAQPLLCSLLQLTCTIILFLVLNVMGQLKGQTDEWADGQAKQTHRDTRHFLQMFWYEISDTNDVRSILRV